MTLTLCGGAISLGAYHFGKHAEAIAKDDVHDISRDTVASNEKIIMNTEPVDANLEKVNMDEKSFDMAINKVDTKGATIGDQFDGDNIFTSRGYYKESYVFLIGWNKNNERTNKYSTKVDLELSDQSVITVCFDASCKSDAKDGAVLSALKKLLHQIKDYPEEPWMSSAKPIVMRTLHVGKNLKQVAEEYYPKKDRWVFNSVLPELDSKLQKQYVKKAFNDDKIDAFVLALDNLDKEEIKAYAKKAYDDNRIDFFSVLSDKLSKEEIKTYAKKAYDDDRINFYSVLFDNLSEKEIKTYTKKAYDDCRIGFFSVLSDKLSKEEIKTYAKKAYDDNRIDFYFMLSSKR